MELTTLSSTLSSGLIRLKWNAILRRRASVRFLKKGQVLTDEDKYLYICASCDKSFHLDCYKSFIVENDLTHLVKELRISFVCGKRCYQKVKKDMFNPNKNNNVPKDNPKFWDNDGDPSSLEVLLDWITDEKNSDKYFGAEDTSSKNGFSVEDGVSKLGLCKQISELILLKNGNNRSPDSVRSKIDDLMSRFKVTHDWIFATGQGVRETEGEENFKQIVIDKFKYYYDLEPVMCQRPSIRPMFTTDDDDINISQRLNAEDEVNDLTSQGDMEVVITTDSTKRKASSAKKQYAEARKISKIGTGSLGTSMFQFGRGNQ